MHPLIARFLSPEIARETLRKHRDAEALEPEERLFADTAEAHPEHRAALLGGKSQRHLGSDAQASLIFLAAHVAARSLEQDPTLAQATAAARQALAAEGASPEETDAFLAGILLEEAFGYEEEVETFDTTYVKEALGEVPAMASLTREAVDAMIWGFAEKSSSEQERKVRQRVARALVDTAWSDGPAPINPEHLEAFYEEHIANGAEEEQETTLRATVQFLELLAREGLVGPQRLSRLRAQLGDEDA
jgi:hypothetical protein